MVLVTIKDGIHEGAWSKGIGMHATFMSVTSFLSLKMSFQSYLMTIK